ncbi:MAG: response regulator [Gemmatimonadota bacterium]|nr:MAG: response regulator [Gemmatimonadota bacterium]
MRMLVVEADRKFARFIRMCLVEDGCAVDMVTTANHAMQLTSLHPYDCLIVGIQLPDMRGVQLATALRREGGAPILMLGPCGSPEHVIEGLDSGADAYLGSPFRVAEFSARIRALVRRPERPANLPATGLMESLAVNMLQPVTS